MKHLAFFAITFFAAVALAQAPATPEKPKPAPAKEAAKPAAEPAKQVANTPRKPRRWNEDARHCLERPTNTEIIKCAEEYL